MTTTARSLFASGVFVAVTVGLAIPAEAAPAPLEGTYVGTLIDDSSGEVEPGATTDWNFEPCGQSCVHVHVSSAPEFDMHQHGSTWSGEVAASGTSCQFSLDANTLVLTEDFSDDGSRAHLQLAKQNT